MNRMPLSLTSVIVLLFIFIGLIAIAYALFSRFAKKPSSKKYNKFGTLSSIGTCPICGTILEKVITAVYPNGTDDKLCYIYGCPHCYHIVEPDTERRCPVCKKVIGPDSYLIARDFLRKDGSEHIHILGCTTCRVSKK